MIDNRLTVIRCWYLGVAGAVSLVLLAICPGLLLAIISAAFCLPLALMMPSLFSCRIASDGFASDSGWTDVSGIWSVGSGVLTTSSAGAVRIHDSSSPTGHGRVRCEVKTDTSATTLSVFGAVVDTDNYIEVRLTVNGGASTLQLFKVETGVSTQLGSDVTVSASTDTFYTLGVCWDGEYATGSFDGNSFWTDSYSGTGTFAGVGASPGAGTATFDEFDFQRPYADDSRCPRCNDLSCIACLTGTAPSGFSIVLAGLANRGGGTCASCTSYNGTFIFQSTNTSSPCIYNHPWSSDPCGFGFAQINFQPFPSSPDPLSAEIRIESSGILGSRATADAGLGDAPLDCGTISFSIDDGGGGSPMHCIPNDNTNAWSVDAII